LNTGEDLTEHLLQAAFGTHGLGQPLKGLRHNYKYLHASVLQKFQLENINPERIVVGAAGVDNH